MLPYYPFYWNDYSGKTYNLTQGQHGAYILFLRHIYTEGKPIPHEDRFSIAKALLEQEQRNADYVLQKFFTKDGDVWRSKKAEKVIEDANNKHQARVIAGKKGGKQKASNARAGLLAKAKQPKPEPKPNIYNNRNQNNMVTPPRRIGTFK